VVSIEQKYMLFQIEDIAKFVSLSFRIFFSLFFSQYDY